MLNSDVSMGSGAEAGNVVWKLFTILGIEAVALMEERLEFVLLLVAEAVNVVVVVDDVVVVLGVL